MAGDIVMAPGIDVEFAVKGYPGSGRRVEDEEDLSRVYRPELLQSAFMGDAILRIGAVDFSTNFGWLTLIDWCIRLNAAMEALAVPEREYVVRFSESDDFISLQRRGDKVRMGSSYSAAIAEVELSSLRQAVRNFIVLKMNWIGRNYPSAMQNPEMEDLRTRLRI